MSVFVDHLFDKQHISLLYYNIILKLCISTIGIVTTSINTETCATACIANLYTENMKVLPND